MNKKSKILSGIKYFDSLDAAIKAKAEAIYFGIDQLNMRIWSSHNFKIEDIAKVAKICKDNNIESYLCLNSIIYTDEIAQMQNIMDIAKENQISAIIAHDMAVLSYAKKKGIRLHMSTQANVSNIEAVRFYSQFADVVVLARELNLQQIKHITDTIKKEQIKGPSNTLLQIELFVHGAMCVAISGKCYMSLAQYNKSANRGQCLQACRRQYKVIEEQTDKELLVDNNRIMSLKDLCTIACLDKLIEAGVNILKIEGRARSCEYVSVVTQVYKEAVEAIYSKTFSKEKIAIWLDRLKSVYNRGFWQGGYYLDNQTDIWCSSHGSQATQKKVYLGLVTNYFSKLQVAEVILHSHEIKLEDEILITGQTTGMLKQKVKSLFCDEKVEIAYKGQKVAIQVEKKVRRKDKLYLIQ